MAELLFIATTIFVAYVVFEVLGGKKDKPKASQAVAAPISNPAPIQAREKVSTPPPSTPVKPAESVKPVAKAATPKPKKAPAAKASASLPANTLKNPKTGEVEKLPGSYAFAKRWIKEALVEEGLLDKIYKNNELDANTSERVKDALHQLKAMEKYQ